MFECGLSEGQGPALEQYRRLARRHRVGLQQRALRLIRKHLIILQVKVSQPAVLVCEHVLNEGPQGLVREFIPTQVQVLRVVQLGQKTVQELVQDLGLAVSETQQVVGQIQLCETGAIRENHVQGL